MGFAINPALNHLDIPEKHVVEIYQSTGEIVLPDARFRGHPCEAFICISRVEKEMRANVALINNALKSTLIYSSDLVARSPQEYPRVLAEAEEFVKGMGFSMAKVNLDFSPAMREVIIKGLRMMRPPSPQRKVSVRQPKVDIPEELVVTTGVQQEEAGAGDLTELLTLRTELASARAALEQVTREKVAAEQQAGSERSSLKASCEQAIESKKQAEERLSQAVAELKRLKEGGAPQGGNEELQRVRQQLDKASAAAAELEKERQRLQGELDNERKRASHLAEEKSQAEGLLAGEKKRLEELHAESTRAMEQLDGRLAAARDELAAATSKLAVIPGYEQALQEARERGAELERQAATAEKELEELRLQLIRSGELQQQLALKEQEIATLKGEMASTETELASAMVELERVRSAAPPAAEVGVDQAEMARIVAEKEAVELEYVRLANASREREAELSEGLAAAEAEVERLGSELEIQAQVATVEQAALRAELRRIIVEGGAALLAPPAAEVAQLQRIMPAAPAPPVAAAPQPPTPAPTRHIPPAVEEIVEMAPEEEEEEDESADLPITPHTNILQEFSSELGGLYSGSGASTTQFSIDQSVTSIAYSDPEEVEAVFYSSNSVQAVPDGKGIQKCKGYIVAMQYPEGYRVYIVWHLTESNRVVICLPEHQPADSDECVQVLKDAIAYFEIVGFMMEITDLGSTRRSYRRALGKIPGLKRSAKEN